jgi:hypothetical protein
MICGARTKPEEGADICQLNAGHDHCHHGEWCWWPNKPGFRDPDDAPWRDVRRGTLVWDLGAADSGAGTVCMVYLREDREPQLGVTFECSHGGWTPRDWYQLSLTPPPVRPVSFFVLDDYGDFTAEQWKRLREMPLEITPRIPVIYSSSLPAGVALIVPAPLPQETAPQHQERIRGIYGLLYGSPLCPKCRGEVDSSGECARCRESGR